MQLNLSPKVLGTVALVVLACVALWLITGDESYLVAVLVAIAGGGTGFALPAATAPAGRPNVSQSEVIRLAELPKHERERVLPAPRR